MNYGEQDCKAQNGVINMKHILIMICIIFTVMGMVSCAPASTPTPEPAPEEESLIGFYPLKEGNVWEYQGEGMEYASFMQKVIFTSGNRHQITVDNGGTVISNVLEESNESIINTYRSGEEFSGENLLDEPGNTNIIILQLPLEKGNFWISEENHYEIIDTEADVVVPAGEFKDCIAVKVTFKDHTSNMIYYYKSGIGMVQSEFKTESGDLITSKLKRYELNDNSD